MCTTTSTHKLVTRRRDCVLQGSITGFEWMSQDMSLWFFFSFASKIPLSFAKSQKRQNWVLLLIKPLPNQIREHPWGQNGFKSEQRLHGCDWLLMANPKVKRFLVMVVMTYTNYIFLLYFLLLLKMFCCQDNETSAKYNSTSLAAHDLQCHRQSHLPSWQRTPATWHG